MNAEFTHPEPKSEPTPLDPGQIGLPGYEPNPNFSLDTWLDRRDTQEDFFTLELGPGHNPMVGGHYEGRRAYLGVENFARPETASHTTPVFAEITAQRPDENAFHLNDTSQQPGEQLTETVRDHSADEIILSNVLGDPKTGARQALLTEVVRVLKPDGEVIIRETRTPKELVRYSPEQLFERTGLQVDRIVSQEAEPELFEQLEQQYHEPRLPAIQAEQYYVFVSPGNN